MIYNVMQEILFHPVKFMILSVTMWLTFPTTSLVATATKKKAGKSYKVITARGLLFPPDAFLSASNYSSCLNDAMDAFAVAYKV